MMKKAWYYIALIMALSISATALACDLTEKTADGYENASVAHAFQHWQQGDKSPIPFAMLDVRTPEEYAEGHIPGAVLIPVQELEQRLGEVPKDRQVYVYCRSGVRSVQASKILAGAGFTHIENVEGGIKAWQAAGFPIEQ